MVYKITRNKVYDLFKDCELVEFVVLEMPTKDLLIHVESVEGKNISVLANNWDDLMSSF